jgi:hypothetical protein
MEQLKTKSFEVTVKKVKIPNVEHEEIQIWINDKFAGYLDIVELGDGREYPSITLLSDCFGSVYLMNHNLPK